jgi:GDPmannose 4,6-dehydratase
MSNNIAVITGAGGMDAKTLTHFLLNKGYKVILTYRRNSFFDVQHIKSLFKTDLEENFNSQLECEVCDVSCQNSVIECIKEIIKKHGRIDELYHLAAMTHVGNSFKQKELSIIVNGQSHYYFLEALKNNSPTTKFYGAMTSELVGGVNQIAYDEDMKWNPKSPYAIGKALGARWIEFYKESEDSHLFCCYGILSNHSNTYRSLDFAVRKITNTAARIFLGKSSQLQLAHLNWARDEHWSDFGCEMMWKMLQLKSPENFVIGNGECHWGEEYVEEAFSYFNLDWKTYVKFDTNLNRPNEVDKLVSNSNKAKEMLGWKSNRLTFKKHIELLCKFDYDLESGNVPVRPDVFELYPE